VWRAKATPYGELLFLYGLRVTKTYSRKCLITLGAAKIGLAHAGNFAAGRAPGLAVSMGAGPKTLEVLVGGVKLFTGPYGKAVGVAGVAQVLEKECRCPNQ
jgi:hypothetical protein